ncbi:MULTISPECIES: LysR substrate-binding domain-containing protein [unclassified Actinomyces]|uniref:LysR substrate-binding domain-containing protein n=1 Tax=unclassified Actinomyces TaxID=2609248 RepID=UPI002017F240|nr:MULTISPECIES: LysR substrate-binding domain-containing protein [unclassified Actinomyces]MCL3777266.1 LysR family transcriptional regulator [Actinomyces sp. AC-20-1]MCL3789922.1 LysR family transcriptional regulator [Actinomyces sp. 187325]MCL3792138.1 LysR family transcriptional regulator [Actinomyces sp. 186855]MCL3793628.1 LysR family transcriptional regulator [Actinomyces sp. 217892]
MPASSLPSFSQLRAFVALCDHQHFGEAASTLGVSQPSLSQAITALEKRVGGELVERTTRRVLVTPLGETLLPYAREAVLSAESFNEAVVNQGQALTGTLRLGLIPTLAPYLIPVIVDGLGRELPRLSPELRELVTNDILDQLGQGHLDAAVISTDVDLQRVASIDMYDEPLVALVPASHPWAGREDVNPSELDDQELLLLDESNCLRDQTLSLCQRYGTNPPVAVATTLSTVVSMVSHGIGVTVLPEGALNIVTGRQGYAVARFGSAPPMRRMGLVHRASSSRTADFQRLARVITDLAVEAGLPVIPLTA